MNRNRIHLEGMPLTPIAKRIMIINLGVWFFLVVILQRFFINEPFIFDWFGLVPEHLINGFWIWQPFTYMFIHSYSIFHILFNMLTLWWIGGDLEPRWGSRYFLTYYLVCGIGSGLFYLLGVTVYYLFTGHFELMTTPVVGASGAIFGLMLAFGMIFGERVVYFMMLFPMKAKYFVLLLGGIEVVTLLNSGEGSGTANLAHLGGLIVGYLFLRFRAPLTRWLSKPRSKKKIGPQLRLVVDNERSPKKQENSPGGPRYWH